MSTATPTKTYTGTINVAGVGAPTPEKAEKVENHRPAICGIRSA